MAINGPMPVDQPLVGSISLGKCLYATYTDVVKATPRRKKAADEVINAILGYKERTLSVEEAAGRILDIEARFR